jgi:hypothetical protein
MKNNLKAIWTVSVLLSFLPAAANSAETVPMTQAQLTSILQERLEGSLGYTFSQFSNMFLVRSQQDLTRAVVLSAADSAVAEANLMSVFPRSYKPTLREFLDAIALQTNTEWMYVTGSKALHSDSKEPLDGMACFEFAHSKQSHLTFSIKAPDDWKVRNGGNKLMCEPPSFPVGIDFWEVGTYSFEKNSGKTMEDIVKDLALEWAKRAKPDASVESLKPVKVGANAALYFETRVPSRLEVELIWRQWVFSSGNHCYFVISTLDDVNAKKLESQVSDILKSFTILEKPNKAIARTPASVTSAAGPLVAPDASAAHL